MQLLYVRGVITPSSLAWSDSTRLPKQARNPGCQWSEAGCPGGSWRQSLVVLPEMRCTLPPDRGEGEAPSSNSVCWRGVQPTTCSAPTGSKKHPVLLFMAEGMPYPWCTRCAHGDRPSLRREARAGRGGALQTDHRVTPWHAAHAVRKGVP